MTKKSRTILFTILIILFFFVTPGVTFYSLGYRFDFDSKKIVQTGAFYFKVFPKSAQIYLDGKQMKKTDFFFGAALIGNLLPKKYEVEIKREGFHPWKKTLEIKEKQVTDAKNIVLVPQNPESSILAKGVENVFFSPDGKKAVLKESGKDGWSLKLLELEKNLKSSLLDQKSLGSGQFSLSEIKFSQDSGRVLLKAGFQGIFNYFLLDFGKVPVSPVSLDFLGKNVQDVFFNPTDAQKLFLLVDEDKSSSSPSPLRGLVFEADLAQKKIFQKITESVKSFRVFSKDVYYLLDSGPDAGFIFKSDFSFSGREKINGSPFPLKENNEYGICVFSDKIFLQDGRDLYLFNPAANNFEKLFEAEKEPEISSDFKKIFYYSDNEIWLLFLKDEFSQPQKSAGEKVFVARFSEKIGNVFWLTAHYLIFNSGPKIKIAEIDDRDGINIADLNFSIIESANPEIFFSQNDKKLYILSGKNLYSSGELVP